MNRSLESVIRFVNLTASGLLAGSLGFGEAALVPGWQEELPHGHMRTLDALREINYFNAIGELQSPELALTAAQILASEAQHWSLVLNVLTEGKLPEIAPLAFVRGVAQISS